MIESLFAWVDNRLAISRGGRHLLNKIFPDHWSFMIGEIALYSFIVLVATGVFLTLYFVPSAHDVVYHGSYVPLRRPPRLRGLQVDDRPLLRGPHGAA